ncbi:hypothetical protein ILYODFUR_006730 [Ilyodon furcidens]|uniref:Uncharacterized protein n=1 Tax=Ilyodon furcidens TaxID=33524 RepID=A0ABV0T8L3_9TELE
MNHSSMYRGGMKTTIHPLASTYLRSGRRGYRSTSEMQIPSPQPVLGVTKSEVSYNPSSNLWISLGSPLCGTDPNTHQILKRPPQTQCRGTTALRCAPPG